MILATLRAMVTWLLWVEQHAVSMETLISLPYVTRLLQMIHLSTCFGQKEIALGLFSPYQPGCYGV